MYFLTHLFTPLCLYNDISLMNFPILRLTADLNMSSQAANIRSFLILKPSKPVSIQSLLFPVKHPPQPAPLFWDCKGRKLFLSRKKNIKNIFSTIPPSIPTAISAFNNPPHETLNLKPPYLRKRSAKVENFSLSTNSNQNI